MQHIGNIKVEKESTVVVHDPATGEIVHVHHVVTTKGGKHPDKATLEKDTLEQFSRAQPKAAKKMALLHVESGQLKPQTAYKVDIKKSALVVVKK